jgi:hypothetical protein
MDPEEPKKPLPIADMQGLSGRELALKRAARERMEHARQVAVEKQKLKPSAVAGTKPASLEEARDLNARALGEILLKTKSLRRFQRLLWSKEDRIAKEMFALAFNHILSTQRPQNGGDQKPTQIIVNNLVARPPKDGPPDKTTVEVR